MSNMELIKKLRDTTGSGIVDCKKALSENNNDIDSAIKWLREKGILKAQKKQDRDTNEGVVCFYNIIISYFYPFAMCSWQTNRTIEIWGFIQKSSNLSFFTTHNVWLMDLRYT